MKPQRKLTRKTPNIPNFVGPERPRNEKFFCSKTQRERKRLKNLNNKPYAE